MQEVAEVVLGPGGRLKVVGEEAKDGVGSVEATEDVVGFGDAGPVLEELDEDLGLLGVVRAVGAFTYGATGFGDAGGEREVAERAGRGEVEDDADAVGLRTTKRGCVARGSAELSGSSSVGMSASSQLSRLFTSRADNDLLMVARSVVLVRVLHRHQIFGEADGVNLDGDADGVQIVGRAAAAFEVLRDSRPIFAVPTVRIRGSAVDVGSPGQRCELAGRSDVGSGRDQQPASADRLLVVITKLALGELVEVVRQNAAAATGSESRAGVGKAPQVGVDLTRYLDTDLMLVATSTDDHGANAVLRHRRHGGHFPLVPYGDWLVGLRLTPISEA
ncbi:hypothetical protein [Nocardioides sp.]|uniref:hypothetical protein n=1 Tax=Nocardioides sp. TaxID=35761 RepID=UPI002C1555AE|nr:hypothetical protein [Nocardioides sp.]HSX67365.1 hypothetical protein [Nocardioides sp.]